MEKYTAILFENKPIVVLKLSKELKEEYLDAGAKLLSLEEAFKTGKEFLTVGLQNKKLKEYIKENAKIIDSDKDDIQLFRLEYPGLNDEIDILEEGCRKRSAYKDGYVLTKEEVKIMQNYFDLFIDCDPFDLGEELYYYINS